jgi:hypothetical protein
VDTTEWLDLKALTGKSATFSLNFMFTRSLFQTQNRIEQQRKLKTVVGALHAGVSREKPF